MGLPGLFSVMLTLPSTGDHDMQTPASPSLLEVFLLMQEPRFHVTDFAGALPLTIIPQW